jgi:hypothetical protein
MDLFGFADERAWENTQIAIPSRKETIKSKSKDKDKEQPISDPFRIISDVIAQRHGEEFQFQCDSNMEIKDKNMQALINDAENMRNLYLWEKQADEANAGIMAANTIGEFAVYADERFMQEFLSIMDQSAAHLKKLIQERRSVIGAVEEAIQKRKHSQNLRLELNHQRYE